MGCLLWYTNTMQLSKEFSRDICIYTVMERSLRRYKPENKFTHSFYSLNIEVNIYWFMIYQALAQVQGI